MEGERGLNDLIYECQWSLEGIEHAKLELDARSWARGMGLRDCREAVCGTSSRSFPSRSPPTDWGELVQLYKDRDVFQASPDELPAIDIHSL